MQCRVRCPGALGDERVVEGEEHELRVLDLAGAEQEGAWAVAVLVLEPEALDVRTAADLVDEPIHRRPGELRAPELVEAPPFVVPLAPREELLEACRTR